MLTAGGQSADFGGGPGTVVPFLVPDPVQFPPREPEPGSLVLGDFPGNEKSLQTGLLRLWNTKKPGF